MFKDASLDDLKMMFAKTIIRYKEFPVFVEDVAISRDEKVMLELYSLSTGECKWYPFNEEDYNFKPVRLGYLNLRGFSYYLYRKPVRKYKQGLALESLAIVDSGYHFLDNEERGRSQKVYKSIKELHSKELVATIKGYYPSLKDALTMFEDMACEVAFDRQFSIDRKMNIFYKGCPVGCYEDGKISFNKGQEYLSNALRKNYEI